tara:strand:- start:997 stop:3018 length:2022 start_codon:yes stop_codon:yes gene_type:complete
MLRNVNFHDSWKDFLVEKREKTQISPQKYSRIKIKIPNKKKLIKEVSEYEFKQIQSVVEKLSPEDLAFYDIFGDKTRIVIDMPVNSRDTPIGQFIDLWSTMGYAVNWEKGLISGEKKITPSPQQGTEYRKFNMKIGKFFSKLSQTYSKYLKNYETFLTAKDAVVWGAGPQDLTAVEKAAATNYRLRSLILTMISPVKGGGEGLIHKRIRKDVEGILKWADYWKKNADSIKKNISSAISNEYSIIISRDPVDIWRMSDFDNIQSCHSPPSRREVSGNTEYYKCAVAEAHGHGAVAYVVNTDDLLLKTNSESIKDVEKNIQDGELFGDTARPGSAGFDIFPLSRVRLRQIRYYNDDQLGHWGPEDWSVGTQLAVPESRVYGEKIPGFVDRVNRWAKENQENQIKNAPKVDNKLDLTKFYAFGGSQSDHMIKDLLKTLFSGIETTGIDSLIHGDVRKVIDTEINLDPEMWMGDIKERLEYELEKASDQWNERFKYAKVGYKLWDSYLDDEIIIIPWVRVEFSWPHEIFKEDKIDYFTNSNTEDVDSLILNSQSIPTAIRVVGVDGDSSHLDWRSGYKEETDQDLGGWVVTLSILISTKGIEHLGRPIGDYVADVDDFQSFCSLIYTTIDKHGNKIKETITKIFEDLDLLKTQAESNELQEELFALKVEKLLKGYNR